MNGARIGLLLAAALAIPVLTGCSTVESSALLGTVDNASGTTEARGERQIFLELTEPRPAYIDEHRAAQEAWMTADYDADRKRPFRAFAIPLDYTLGTDAIQSTPPEGG